MTRPGGHTVPAMGVEAVKGEENDAGHDSERGQETHGDEEPQRDFPQNGLNDRLILWLLATW